MSLETLKNVKSVGGFPVVIMDDLKELYPEKFNESGAMDYSWFEKDIRPRNFIYVRHDVNSLSFTLQNGPIKENGINGCQVDTIIEAAKHIISGLNEQYPCIENTLAVSGLNVAISALALKKRDREARGVEGTNNQ